MLAKKYPVICVFCENTYQYSDLAMSKGVCPRCFAKRVRMKDREKTKKLVLAICLLGITLIALGVVIFNLRSL